MMKEDSVAALKERARLARRHLLMRGTVSEAEVDAIWPGGEENPHRGRWGWIVCLMQLTRFAGRMEHEGEATQDDAALMKQLALDAVMETPESVELFSFDDAGVRQRMTVYAKSDVALRVVHGVHLKIAAILDGLAVLERDESAESLDLRLRALLEQSYLQRVAAWIATTPGPGLPFPETAMTPVTPPEIDALNPLDFYAIAGALQRVNVAPLAALKPSTTKGESADWSVFYSSFALESKTTPASLSRDRSLVGLIAQAAEVSRSRDEAMARAERERASTSAAA